MCVNSPSAYSPLPQHRGALPAAVDKRLSRRLKQLTAPIVAPPAGAGGASGGKGGSRSRRSSAPLPTPLALSEGAAAVLATTQAHAEVLRAQSKELVEALAANKAKMAGLEKDTLQVIEVLERTK
jgi:hypothetical protein